MRDKIKKMFERFMEIVNGSLAPIAASLLVATTAMGAVQPDRLTQKPRALIGSGVSQNSDINFDVGLGASNPRLRYKISDQSFEFNKGILRFGTGAAGDQVFEADIGSGANNPKFRYNDTTNAWQFSNDGTSYDDISNGAVDDDTRVVFVKDIKADGVAGGACTSGSFQTRTLNTTENDQAWISLASNQITLEAGTYELNAAVPGKQVDSHKAKLRNITDSTDTAIGSNALTSSATDNTISHTFINAVFTIASAKAFEIQHRCTTTSGDGFGSASSYGVSEVYTVVRIRKLD